MKKLASLICLVSAAMLIGAGPPVFDGRVRPMNWIKPIDPFRIAGNIYYVGTEGLAAYLIDTPDGAILIDGTLEQNATLIEHNIEAVGVPLDKVRILLSDHAHYDHVGALAQIKRDTGAQFFASAGDRRALEHGAQGNATIGFPPIKVDRVLADGQRIQLGNTELTTMLTPGHTQGCTSYTTELREGDRTVKILFLCSLTVAGNHLVGHPSYPGIVDDYRSTFDRLEHLDADIVLTSHPEIAQVIEHGRRSAHGHADAFVDPKLLPRIVKRAEEAFQQRLVVAKAKHRRDAGKNDGDDEEEHE